MAQLDVVRQRIVVSDEELETLRLVHNGEDVDPAARQALVDAGLVRADATPGAALAPIVEDLVAVVTDPALETLVETAGPHGPAVARLALREETLWYTDPWPQDEPGGPLTYCRDELPQLLWILARLTGLRRQAVPKAARPFTVPLRAVDAVVQTMALGEDEWEPARTVATAQLERFFAEVGEEDRVMLMATLSYLEATVRVTTVWGPGDGDVRALALWNCGPGGWWRRTEPVEPLHAEQITPSTRARYEPVDAADVWRAFADLLPSSAELRGVVERTGAAT